MNRFIIFVLVYVIIQISFLMWRQRTKAKMLEIQKKQAELRALLLQQNYETNMAFLQAQIAAIHETQNGKVSPDVIGAVKYAMKHAHLDNGGDAEDFVKFKKCYEELTKK